jgi:transcriptional regulator with XRE-family HTH domain
MKTEQISAARTWEVRFGNALPSGPSTFISGVGSQVIAAPPVPSAWNDPEERKLTLEAHVRESIAWQVRVNREERGLTQKDLAQLIGTGQPAISKIEDPQGGDVRLSSIVRIAHGFDCALQVRFVGFSEFWSSVAIPRSDRMLAPSFGAEAAPLVRRVLDQMQVTGAE